MNGKELIIRAMKGETTERPAWLPFVGCHGAQLIGKEADEYLQSAELICEGLKKAKALYRPDGLPISFDLQLEAEALGCRLNWAKDVPPAVTSHPLAGGKGISSLPPFDVTGGRIPTVMQALDLVQAEMGDEVALYGLICGPFTLALHLLGNDIFLDMFDDEARVKAIVDYAADVGIAMAQEYLAHGATVVAVVDPMTSQISADHFETFVTPSVNKVFDAIREAGGLSSMFVCGDVTRNLEVMVATHADNVCVDEQIPMDKLKNLCLPVGKSFGGNIKLTAVLLLGDEQDAQREVLQILDAAGDTGFILAPGCDLPFHVPPANLQAVADMVHDPYQRELARSSLETKAADPFDDIQVPDYLRHDGVVIDVITLDSTSCAPCQYMMEAVQRAAEMSPHKVFINEHKIKERSGIGIMVKLGVQNLPTICLEGEVKFASIIPDLPSLVKAIDEAHKQKQVGTVA